MSRFSSKRAHSSLHWKTSNHLNILKNFILNNINNYKVLETTTEKNNNKLVVRFYLNIFFKYLFFNKDRSSDQPLCDY